MDEMECHRKIIEALLANNVVIWQYQWQYTFTLVSTKNFGFSLFKSSLKWISLISTSKKDNVNLKKWGEK